MQKDIDNKLIKFVKRNDLAMVTKLVNIGADVNACDGFKKSSLHYAACSNFLEIAEFLLKHDADPNQLINPLATCCPLIAAIDGGFAHFRNELIGVGHVENG